MKQRRNRSCVFLKPICTVFGFALLLSVIGCNDQPEHAAHEGTTDANHTKHNSPGPGINNKESIDLYAVSLPENYNVISSQKTITPAWEEKKVTLSANGYIAADERRDNTVSARFSGRIDKLFVKYNFQYIKKGEKVMDIYSPELNTVQEELLFLLKTKAETGLVKKAEKKLEWMGVSDLQLREIETTGKALYHVTVLSPYDGYVYFSNSTTPSMSISETLPSGMESMGMQSGFSPNQNMNAVTAQIREGSYVSKGQTLFRVNDLKAVYGIILAGNAHSEISVDTPVELVSELDKDNSIKSKISLVEPGFQNGQKFLSLRVYLNNESGKLKINSLLHAMISTVTTKQLLVPNSSILSLGERKVVWVKTGEAENRNHIFRVRDIRTGISQEGMTEVITGLTDKDQIALDAGYMADRESLLKSK